MLTCQICQHQNPEGAEYCENCGAALPASAPAASPPPVAPAAPPTPTAPAADATTPPVADPAPAESVPAEAAAVPQTAPLAPELVPGGIDDGAAAAASAAAATAAPATPATAPASGATGQNPRLVGVRYGAPTGEQYPLLGARLLVGRFDPETGPVDLDLSQSPEAAQISRQHAELYQEADGRWFVRDLGSTNGVFVKSTGNASFGPRITEPRALASGDEVAFGNARYVFQTD